MKTSKFLTSTCRHCRHYMPQGRRGGFCQQLSVPVQSRWDACSLAIPPFTPAWQELERLVFWQQQRMMLEETIPGQCSEVNSESENQSLVSVSAEAVAV